MFRYALFFIVYTAITYYFIDLPLRKSIALSVIVLMLLIAMQFFERKK